MTNQDGCTEADITINGIPLTFAQSMTLRVALSGFMLEMALPNPLGDDEHGQSMTASYRVRAMEIQQYMLLNQRRQ